jgi:hypothetical protein
LHSCQTQTADLARCFKCNADMGKSLIIIHRHYGNLLQVITSLV